MKHRKSPCIKICEFVQPKGWCIGCGRTRSECDQWKKMTLYQQQNLLKQLDKRLTQLKSDQP